SDDRIGVMECWSNGFRCASLHYSITPLPLPERRLRLGICHERFANRLALFDELDLANRRESCPRRNEMAHDDVFLEPAQTIDLAERRRFGEDARSILERRRRNEAVGFERGLGDPEQ